MSTVTIIRRAFIGFTAPYPHREWVHFYKAAILHCYSSPGRTNVWIAPFVFSIFSVKWSRRKQQEDDRNTKKDKKEERRDFLVLANKFERLI